MIQFLGLVFMPFFIPSSWFGCHSLRFSHVAHLGAAGGTSITKSLEPLGQKNG